MTEDSSQANSKYLEYLAFLAVIVFGLGMTYAIYITNKTVNNVQGGHYAAESVDAQQLNQPDQPEPDSASLPSGS